MTMTEAKKRNEGTMTLRVDRDLLKAFQNIAKDNNRTASQLVRDYMMNYVKKHGQGFIQVTDLAAQTQLEKYQKAAASLDKF